MLPQASQVRLRIGKDNELRDLSRNTAVVFQMHCRKGNTWTVRVRGECVTVEDDARPADNPEFRVELDAADWAELLSPHPSPQKQHVLAFVAPRGTGQILGSAESWAQHIHLVRRIIEVSGGRPEEVTRVPDLGGIEGRYVRMDVTNWGECDVYYESAGHGLPVILLPTAGSDSRQYHATLTDPDLGSRYRLIAFDLPWHGKSMPAQGRRNTEYMLTTQTYTDCIANFIKALGLPTKPVLVGASMAGAAVIEMAALHPQQISGAVSSQAGPRVANRLSSWLRHTKVNQAVHVPEWTYGLMSPRSPKTFRDRVWWGYSQGGYGVYEEDIRYYSDQWDIEKVSHLMDSSTPPIILMNGVYDYSVPSEATLELAASIPGAIFREMPELGHFPHAENPAVFNQYLRWALETICIENKTHQGGTTWS